MNFILRANNKIKQGKFKNNQKVIIKFFYSFCLKTFLFEDKSSKFKLHTSYDTLKYFLTYHHDNHGFSLSITEVGEGKRLI